MLANRSAPGFLPATEPRPLCMSRLSYVADLEETKPDSQSGRIVRRCLHPYAWSYAALLSPSSSHAAVLDGSATRRRRAGLHAKNRMTEEPNAAKVARSHLQASRSREGAA